jgi:hypothetical protein
MNRSPLARQPIELTDAQRRVVTEVARKIAAGETLTPWESGSWRAWQVGPHKAAADHALAEQVRLADIADRDGAHDAGAFHRGQQRARAYEGRW